MKRGSNNVKRHKFWLILGILLFSVGVAGFIWDQLAMPGSSLAKSDILFEEGHGIQYAEAQKLYKQAGSALREKRADEALDTYRKLEGAYLRLRPLILLHQADAYILKGDENQAQIILTELVSEYQDSPVTVAALYKQGQSYMRTQQYEKAKAQFKTLVQHEKHSNFSVASHYYLGELALKAEDAQTAKDHFEQYLDHIMDGTFSSAAVNALQDMPGQKSAKENAIIGKALLAQNKQADALPYLQKAALPDVWLPLGKALIATGHKPEGLKVLEKGLFLSVPEDDIQEALQTIIAERPQRKARLQQLLKMNPKSGGDLVLWHLQKLSSGAEKTAYAQQLLDRYPKSNWAPETSWELMWPHYQAGRHGEFLKRVDYHLKQYPTSNSAPRVMFWKAKLFLSQGKQNIGFAILNQLKNKYPREYYAFRAQQILSGNRSPWATSTQLAYPPASELKPDAARLAAYVGDKNAEPLVEELIKVESPEDLSLVLKCLYLKDEPPPLVSLIHQQEQEYAQSIRTIRDYLDLHRKAGVTDRDPELSKLLFPVVFSEPIDTYSKRNNLDPFLVQALARQESYFNPYAVSSSHAMGLMQLLPSTAAGVAKEENLAGFQQTALFDPDTNIRLGTRYLRYLHERFKGNSMQAVGGYNGGPNAMARWSAASSVLNKDPDMFVENIPYAQSRDYIKHVFSHYWNYRQLYLNS